MSTIQNALSQHYQKLSLLLILGGFLTVLGELVFSGHTTGSQVIGVYATILGALLVAHGLLDDRMSKYLAVACIVLALFGVVGAYKHLTTRQAKQSLATIHQVGDTTSDPSLLRVISPPLAAPLALSGLSLFAFTTLLSAAHELDKKKQRLAA